MDNNNSSVSTPQPGPQVAQTPFMPPGTPQPPVVAPAPQGVTPPMPPSSHEGSSKMVFWLIGGVVVVLLTVGGIYLYLNNQQKDSGVSTLKQTTTPVNTPVPQAVTEKEVDSVDIGDVETELKDVDKDLQGL